MISMSNSRSSRRAWTNEWDAALRIPVNMSTTAYGMYEIKQDDNEHEQTHLDGALAQFDEHGRKLGLHRYAKRATCLRTRRRARQKTQDATCCTDTFCHLVDISSRCQWIYPTLNAFVFTVHVLMSSSPSLPNLRPHASLPTQPRTQAQPTHLSTSHHPVHALAAQSHKGYLPHRNAPYARLISAYRGFHGAVM